jgi:hypothetical protein
MIIIKEFNMKFLLLILAMCAASPALAQTVTTSTTLVPSLECLQQAQNDYKSAWQQTAGNPYYDSWEDPNRPKNGIADSLEGNFAFIAAARGCTFRKLNPSTPTNTPTYTDGVRAGINLAKKALENL